METKPEVSRSTSIEGAYNAAEYQKGDSIVTPQGDEMVVIATYVDVETCELNVYLEERYGDQTLLLSEQDVRERFDSE